MAKDEKKGGFFSRFRKDAPSEESSIKPASPPAVSVPNRNVTPQPESRNSLASAVPPQVPVVPTPAAAPVPASSESDVDTVEAFSRYCSALVAIGTSQLKVIEMTLAMLSHSLNNITDSSKTKG